MEVQKSETPEEENSEIIEEEQRSETKEEVQNDVNKEKQDLLIEDEIVEENFYYFNFYVKAPRIFTIILGVLFLIAGIVVSVIIENAALFFLVAILGAIVCFANYLLLKLYFSHIILQVYYLKKIEENTRKN